MNFQALEDALAEWVETALALPHASVIWADQEVGTPDYPYVTLRLPSMRTLGVTDAEEYLTDLTRDAGEEIELATWGHRDLTLSVQAFSEATTGNNAARALLATLQTSLSLESIRAILRAAGLTVADRGTVLNISDLVDTRFQGRASLDVRFATCESVSEYTGYIDRVSGVGTVESRAPHAIPFDSNPP